MIRNLGFKGIHKKKLVLNGEIDKKLKENKNLPLEDILSEDTIIDEIENKNKLLYEYFNKEKIKQMIDYIIKQPPLNSSHDKGYKFPWVCSQIFSIEDREFMKYFLKTNSELKITKNNEIEVKKKEDPLKKTIKFNENIKNKKNTFNMNNNRINTTLKSSRNASNIGNRNKKNNIKINNILSMRNSSLKTRSNKNLNNNNYNNNKNIDLLDYLLTFLNNNSELNYVLCGYFSSVMKNLLTMEYNLIIKYLYLVRKDSIKRMIYHSYRYSIAELLNKILQYNNNEELTKNRNISIIRMELLEEIFTKLNLELDTEKYYCISTLITSLASDKKLLSDMLNNKKIIKCLITNQFKNLNLIIMNSKEELAIINRRRNFNTLIDVIISWLNSINNFDLKMPSMINKKEKIKINNFVTHTVLSTEFFGILNDLIKKNFNKTNKKTAEHKIKQCFDDKLLLPLGLYRTKIVELLGHLFIYFKNIPSLYDKLLIDSQFFENAFAYLFEYEFNNIYQDALLFLLKTFLNYCGNHDILSDFLFKKFKLLDKIITHLKDIEIVDSDIIQNKTKFIYKSGSNTNHGYIAFLHSLSYKINTRLGGEQLKINGTLSREGSMTFMTRATPFVPKEEIDEFYGMDTNDLYDEVEDENDAKKPKFNTAVKCMKKYLTNNWKEFFKENIIDKIKLYEAKLYKEKTNERRSVFHNPFIVEDSCDINENNFGLGEDEDEDVLAKERKKLNHETDFERMLYEGGDDDKNLDPDKDINMNNNNNNKFKMSMRFAIKNNVIKKSPERRGSAKKICVDEVDEVDEDDDDDENKCKPNFWNNDLLNNNKINNINDKSNKKNSNNNNINIIDIKKMSEESFEDNK